MKMAELLPLNACIFSLNSSFICNREAGELSYPVKDISS